MNSNDVTESIDYIGMIFSILCGIHCIVTPFIIISAPSLGHYLESVWVHFALIMLAILAFYQSVYKKYKIHQSKLVLYLGIGGFILIAISYFNEMFFLDHDHHGDHFAHADDLEWISLTVVGGMMLITSHVLNLCKCRCLKKEGK